MISKKTFSIANIAALSFILILLTKCSESDGIATENKGTKTTDTIKIKTTETVMDTIYIDSTNPLSVILVYFEQVNVGEYTPINFSIERRGKNQNSLRYRLSSDNDDMDYGQFYKKDPNSQTYTLLPYDTDIDITGKKTESIHFLPNKPTPSNQKANYIIEYKYSDNISKKDTLHYTINKIPYNVSFTPSSLSVNIGAYSPIDVLITNNGKLKEKYIVQYTKNDGLVDYGDFYQKITDENGEVEYKKIAPNTDFTISPQDPNNPTAKEKIYYKAHKSTDENVTANYSFSVRDAYGQVYGGTLDLPYTIQALEFETALTVDNEPTRKMYTRGADSLYIIPNNPNFTYYLSFDYNENSQFISEFNIFKTYANASNWTGITDKNINMLLENPDEKGRYKIYFNQAVERLYRLDITLKVVENTDIQMVNENVVLDFYDRIGSN